MEQATGAGEKKSESGTWKIEDGNVVVAGEDTSIMKVVPNGDLTMITVINNGKRIDIPKENQTPIRKIPVKELTPEQKQREALRDSVLGEYEYTYDDGGKDKWVFLENGTIDSYSYDKLTSRLSYVMVNIYEWSIVDGEIHLKQDDREINVLRINADKSITWIAMIEDGKRKDYPKETQSTRKKIK